MAYIGIIPARYASTRFPGKPLSFIGDKTMIQQVYERCLESDLHRVIVATDDKRIETAVSGFGGKAVMTSPLHLSGTDRCGEAARLLCLNENDIIVNIQGDEPFIQPREINLLIQKFQQPEIQIATLIQKIEDPVEIENTNIVKVVFTMKEKALYFSRNKIPFIRDAKENIIHYKHKGIYAFRNQTLQNIIQLPESHLEKNEKLEQLRWLENDYDIFIAIVQNESISIDTPEDLIKANLWIKRK